MAVEEELESMKSVGQNSKVVDSVHLGCLPLFYFYLFFYCNSIINFLIGKKR